MTFTRVLPYTLAALTALTLTACGEKSQNDTSDDGSIAATTEIRDALVGTSYECSSWSSSDISEYGVCGGDSFGVASVSISDDPYAQVVRDMGLAGSYAGAIYGTNWVFYCGEKSAESCVETAPKIDGTYIAHQPVTHSSSSVPTPTADTHVVESEPVRTPAPSASGGGMMDGIYADMMQDEGIDVSASEMSRVSSGVCDSLEAGSGQQEALSIVEKITGETGWRATRILEGAVVNRCAQYVDYTY